MFGALKKCIYNVSHVVIFKLDPPFYIDLQKDNHIIFFKSLDEVPHKIASQLFSTPLSFLMKHRLKHKKAVLICYMKEDRLVAYGWIQDWYCFKYLRKIVPKATMLGPFWTHPSCRGQGIYGKMLEFSLSLSNNNELAIIYASVNNESSLKGIRKKIFQELGLAKIFSIFTVIKFVRMSKSYPSS